MQLGSCPSLFVGNTRLRLRWFKLAAHQLPETVNIAYFDTTFHAGSISPHVYTYPLDPEMAQKKIRKYGFYGINYSFVPREAAEFLQKVRLCSPLPHPSLVC